MTGTRTSDAKVASQRPNHYTTEPPVYRRNAVDVFGYGEFGEKDTRVEGHQRWMTAPPGGDSVVIRYNSVQTNNNGITDMILQTNIVT